MKLNISQLLKKLNQNQETSISKSSLYNNIFNRVDIKPLIDKDKKESIHNPNNATLITESQQKIILKAVLEWKKNRLRKAPVIHHSNSYLSQSQFQSALDKSNDEYSSAVTKYFNSEHKDTLKRLEEIKKNTNINQMASALNKYITNNQKQYNKIIKELSNLPSNSKSSKDSNKDKQFRQILTKLSKMQGNNHSNSNQSNQNQQVYNNSQVYNGRLNDNQNLQTRINNYLQGLSLSEKLTLITNEPKFMQGLTNLMNNYYYYGR